MTSAARLFEERKRFLRAWHPGKIARPAGSANCLATSLPVHKRNMETLSNRVLAIHPTTMGFGWVLFDDCANPLDWGVAKVRERNNTAVLVRVGALLERTLPSELVLEDADAPDSMRKSRIRRLCRMVLDLAGRRGVNTSVYCHSKIVDCFREDTARTRYEIAVAISKRIADFEHLLPPKRKIWLAEDPRMGLFDAAAVGITHAWQRSNR